MVIEVGSGNGFIKELIPEVITTDILQYDSIDDFIVAMNMPYKGQSIKYIFI